MGFWLPEISLVHFLCRLRECADTILPPQRVAALVRPESISKPATETIRRTGVEIRLGDINDSIERLTEILTGVDVFISTVVGWLIDEQKGIIRAAKAAGVKRVIPCDFATPGEKGVRGYHDQVSVRKP